VGEKSNMDALYATLSVNRNTVVAGRYLFALAFNLCAILFSFAFAVTGILVSGTFGLGMGVGAMLLTGTVLAGIFIAIQAIQLPFFFKMGYTKAKFFSFIPYIALVVGYLTFTMATEENGIVSQLEGVMEHMAGGMLLGAAMLALLLVYYLSYRLSLVFYRKREF
jgi:hypothetical protein